MELIAQLPGWASPALQLAMLIVLVQMRADLRHLMAATVDQEKRLRLLEQEKGLSGD